MGRPANLERRYRLAIWVATVAVIFALQADAAPAPEQHSLQATVAQMDRGNAAGGDVYFVGFAGFGEQRVFRKEAELAREVFGARFATGNRSLLLVNDIHDRRTYPFATSRESARRL